ncbi:hypothetical protein JCM3770_001361 [Rhodotorula araucariae]
MPANLPAHATKHLPVLAYTLPDRTLVRIAQDNSSPDSTGRTVWLGAQVLSVYLHDLLSSSSSASDRATRRAIDLGSGTGLVALSLAALGYTTLATDLPALVSGLLGANVSSESPAPFPPSRLAAHPLDWFTAPEDLSFPRGHAPPFDLIATADTVYAPALSAPLLRTLAHLALAGRGGRPHHRPPAPVFLALERRDPALVDAFLDLARGDEYGFKCARVEHARLRRLVEDPEGTLAWEDEADWDGVEVWKLKLGREAVARARAKSTKGAGAGDRGQAGDRGEIQRGVRAAPRGQGRDVA